MVTTLLEASRNSNVLIFWLSWGNCTGTTVKAVTTLSEGRPPFEADIVLSSRRTPRTEKNCDNHEYPSGETCYQLDDNKQIVRNKKKG